MSLLLLFHASQPFQITDAGQATDATNSVASLLNGTVTEVLLASDQSAAALVVVGVVAESFDESTTSDALATGNALVGEVSEEASLEDQCNHAGSEFVGAITALSTAGDTADTSESIFVADFITTADLREVTATTLSEYIAAGSELATAVDHPDAGAILPVDAEGDELDVEEEVSSTAEFASVIVNALDGEDDPDAGASTDVGNSTAVFAAEVVDLSASLLTGITNESLVANGVTDTFVGVATDVNEPLSGREAVDTLIEAVGDTGETATLSEHTDGAALIGNVSADILNSDDDAATTLETSAAITEESAAEETVLAAADFVSSVLVTATVTVPDEQLVDEVANAAIGEPLAINDNAVAETLPHEIQESLRIVDTVGAWTGTWSSRPGGRGAAKRSSRSDQTLFPAPKKDREEDSIRHWIKVVNANGEPSAPAEILIVSQTDPPTAPEMVVITEPTAVVQSAPQKGRFREYLERVEVAPKPAIKGEIRAWIKQVQEARTLRGYLRSVELDR